MLCLNVCDILDPSAESSFFEHLIAATMARRKNAVERLYVGSYSCARYFLSLRSMNAAVEMCRSFQIPMTLVVPVASQGLLADVKDQLIRIVNETEIILDEVAVNDVGMLRYCRETLGLKLCLGRQLFKDQRDPRVPEFDERHSKPSLTYEVDPELFGTGRISCMELDAISHYIDLPSRAGLNYEIAVHVPLVLMTTGMVCKYASIGMDVDKKFRPNMPCSMQCLQGYERTHGFFNGAEVDYLRLGRSVYSLPHRSTLYSYSPDRIIYYPLEEVEAALHA